MQARFPPKQLGARYSLLCSFGPRRSVVPRIRSHAILSKVGRIRCDIMISDSASNDLLRASYTFQLIERSVITTVCHPVRRAQL